MSASAAGKSRQELERLYAAFLGTTLTALSSSANLRSDALREGVMNVQQLSRVVGLCLLVGLCFGVRELAPAFAWQNAASVVAAPFRAAIPSAAAPTGLASGREGSRAGQSGSKLPHSTALRADAASLNPPAQAKLVANYGKLPLSFEANHGQTDPQVKFLSRGSGYTLFLTGNEAVLDLSRPIQKANGTRQMANVAQRSPFNAAVPPSLLGLAPPGTRPGGIGSATRGGEDERSSGVAWRYSEEPITTTNREPRTTNAVLRMRLVGANPNAAVTGLDELPGKTNYFIGNDPKKWRTNVPTYARVRYHDVYSGIDLVYYGNQGGQLEHDFVVEPGADPGLIGIEVGEASPRRLAARKGIHKGCPYGSRRMATWW